MRYSVNYGAISEKREETIKEAPRFAEPRIHQLVFSTLGMESLIFAESSQTKPCSDVINTMTKDDTIMEEQKPGVNRGNATHLQTPEPHFADIWSHVCQAKNKPLWQPFQRLHIAVICRLFGRTCRQRRERRVATNQGVLASFLSTKCAHRDVTINTLASTP